MRFPGWKWRGGKKAARPKELGDPEPESPESWGWAAFECEVAEEMIRAGHARASRKAGGVAGERLLRLSGAGACAAALLWTALSPGLAVSGAIAWGIAEGVAARRRRWAAKASELEGALESVLRMREGKALGEAFDWGQASAALRLALGEEWGSLRDPPRIENHRERRAGARPEGRGRRAGDRGERVVRGSSLRALLKRRSSDRARLARRGSDWIR